MSVLGSLGNALLYTVAALAVFAVVIAALRRSRPADLPQAIVTAAIVLGAAWIIAATMH
ncbi:MAG: hypothetical protein SFV18_10095 [Bryobacteraceae bacterium]|nr:hypothetical protein [Bryobacteraceae bacterium]